MTMKFKVGSSGFLFPADPMAKAGARRGSSVSVVEVLNIPEGSTYKEVGKLMELTKLPPDVFRIEHSQLGKDLFSPKGWPDKRKVPKSLKEKW